jgi:hypothetical protein
MADLFENVRFITADVDYAWLHTRETWAVGQVNLLPARSTLKVISSKVASQRVNHKS